MCSVADRFLFDPAQGRIAIRCARWRRSTKTETKVSNTALTYTRIAMLIAGVLGPAPAAWAFSSEPPTVHVNPNGVLLTCHPVLDRADRDPPIEADIMLTFQAKSNDFAPYHFNIVYKLWSGQTINRDDQYTGLGIVKVPGKADWTWTGIYNRDNSVTMKGRLIENSNGWFYQETVFKNGYVQHYIPQMSCEVVETPESSSSSVPAPTPAPTPAPAPLTGSVADLALMPSEHEECRQLLAGIESFSEEPNNPETNPGACAMYKAQRLCFGVSIAESNRQNVCFKGLHDPPLTASEQQECQQLTPTRPTANNIPNDPASRDWYCGFLKRVKLCSIHSSAASLTETDRQNKCYNRYMDLYYQAHPAKP